MSKFQFRWVVACTAVGVALAVFAVRTGRVEAPGQAPPAIDAAEREAAVAEMMVLLEMDPRVRRQATQGAVEKVAGMTSEGSVETWFALGLLKFYRDKDYAAAESAWLRVVKARPDWSWIHNSLGTLYFTQGLERKAMESFVEAMRLEPEWSRPHGDLAILYRLSDRMREAVTHAQSALKKAPADPIAHYNYGVILDLQGKHEKARAEYEAAVRLDPELPAPYYNLACGYARDGDTEAALRLLTRTIGMEAAFYLEAIDDPDFDSIRDTKDFVAFMSSNKP